MKFLGIDLGWTSGETGLCCLSWQNDRLNILDLNRQQQLGDIFSWIDTWVAVNEPALIAVDAPTLIPNLTGMRLPDKLTHKYFRRYHAGCYPANLSRPFAQRTVAFGVSLSKRGFLHAATIEPKKLGRYQIEVYPHPAIVHFFGLDRILKYKKGNLAQKKAELNKLRQYITEILPKREPFLSLSPFSPLTCNFDSLKGSELKDVEDRLDSLICAYIGAYYWYWGQERNLILGDTSTGYIVVPSK
ncbi:MAG: DUF429 domain-containing protein [Oscillatoria sp. PMC 1051.18]|nr:DUF429 domain-containing protein [Oscillatoria sp. PMC 1050.18]MEC5032263.1 DUF429 domain-containing protein [Oscillatoria sp. PMC 1051.18]